MKKDSLCDLFETAVLTSERLHNIALRAVQELCHAHSKGIVYGDVK